MRLRTNQQMHMKTLVITLAVSVAAGSLLLDANSDPVRVRKGLVISATGLASEAGLQALKAGGTAVDAAVATAFALAVTFPTAGNIGGGGFLVLRPATGDPVAYDFRETAPSGSTPAMWLRDGKYDPDLHHDSVLSVGVPGTVAGLHLAWKEHGKLPWRQLVEPAIRLARDGFEISDGLARDLASNLRYMQRYPASVAQFSRNGTPYEAGDILRQPDLARTLERIASDGPADFYQGETARLIEREMQRLGGLITRADLQAYVAKKRKPLTGSYRGYEIITMPPVSSGGVALLEMLNILEGFDLASTGVGSAATVHLMAESMRRTYADRARYLGDPDFVHDMPIERLTSRAYAAELRKTIDPNRASVSSPTRVDWPAESPETTHFSVVDADRNAVSMTYTLEGIYGGYGSMIVVPGAGVLLNSEMGDFNAAPELTTAGGLIGTPPNLAAPGKRPLSSMTPTILARDGRVFMVTGSPGGRTIINTVLQTILNVVDFRMNAQDAADAGRIHHQWLPDRIQYEERALSPDTLALLKQRGHALDMVKRMGAAHLILYNPADNLLEGGIDRRRPDAGAAGW